MINIEYENYTNFYNYIKDKKVLVICDENTKKYYQSIASKLENYAQKVFIIKFKNKHLLPDNEAINKINNNIKDFDYLLAIGSGTLNDLAKYVATINHIDSGILATAPSMDGYASKGSALMLNNKKVTETVNMPHDILIDSNILSSAPKVLISSGFGDIIGKYTCLTDWKLSNIVNNEKINKEAYELMENSLNKVVNNVDLIAKFDKNGILFLMKALVDAGVAMAICGNSRPASGSEHHQSHFLEMYFVENKLTVFPHGITVALGSLISIELYKHLLITKKEFAKKDKIIELANQLPDVDTIRNLLIMMDCKVKFSTLHISKETFKEMVYNAYKVRDRYTILTFYHDNNLFDEIIDELITKYY